MGTNDAEVPMPEFDAAQPRIIESCNSTWVFDLARQRFRRVPRGSDTSLPTSDHEWEAFHRLDIDAGTGAFAVVLNADGTRLLSSFQHRDPCPHCGGEATAEVALPELRQAAG